MDDARQELHQKSLRNVRALLDREEAEAARQKKALRLLLVALVPAVLLGLLAIRFGSDLKNEKLPGYPAQRPDCVARTWAEKSAAREREIRLQNPAITASELGAQLQREDGEIRAAAVKRCPAPLGPGMSRPG